MKGSGQRVGRMAHTIRRASGRSAVSTRKETGRASLPLSSQLTWMRRYAERDLLDDAPVVRDWLDAFAALPPVAAALAS